MQNVKCIIFDLDNTLWDGVALEQIVVLREFVPELLNFLDERGVLMSISSKGEEAFYLQQLKNFEIADYFLVPQISEREKKESIRIICEKLRLAWNEIIFVDDDLYELNKISFFLPEIKCIRADRLEKLSQELELTKYEITQESRSRRDYFVSEMKLDEERRNAKDELEFMRSMKMQVSFRKAERKDISRIYELLERTHKLNSLLQDSLEISDVEKWIKEEKVLVLEYCDCYFSHGIMGAFVIRLEKEKAIFEVISISCRLLARGIGNAVMSYITNVLLEKAESIDVLMSIDNRNIFLKYILKRLGYRWRTENVLTLSQKNFQKVELDYINIHMRRIGNDTRSEMGYYRKM